MEARTENITPSIAAKYLSKNASNRPLQKQWVRELSKRMSDGDWKLSAEPIIFDTDGNLANGQHRLNAVIESGTSQTLMVVRGQPVESFFILDQGKKRSMADAVGHSPSVVNAINYLHKLVYNTPADPSRKKMWDELANCGTLKLANELIEYCGSYRSYFSSGAVKASAVYMMMRKPKSTEYIKQTYKTLVDLDFDSMPKIAQALTRHVLNSKAREEDRSKFLRGCRVFDESRAFNGKIVVTDQAIADVVKEAREFYLATMQN
jgi:hypothetical protein